MKNKNKSFPSAIAWTGDAVARQALVASLMDCLFHMNTEQSNSDTSLEVKLTFTHIDHMERLITETETLLEVWMTMSSPDRPTELDDEERSGLHWLSGRVCNDWRALSKTMTGVLRKAGAK